MQPETHNLDRRQFLQITTTAAASLLLGATACQLTPEPAAADGAPVEATATPLAETATTCDSAQIDEPLPTLRVALSVLPTTFDPALFENIEVYPFGFAIFDGLVWVDAQLTPQPMLAERWETNRDGHQWIFHLRTDVTFHHGSPFTAADVEYTVTRLLDRKLGSPLEPVLRFVQKVEAVDDHTVRFHLATPNVDLPLLLAAPQLRILPHDYAMDRMMRHPSGTGPFRFDEHRSGELIRYVRNPDYWAADRIAIAALEHIYIPALDDQVAALVCGKLDLLLEIGPDQIAQLQGNPDIVVRQTPSGRYQNLAMRVKGHPFDDKRVRQALKACLDRSELHQQVLQGQGAVGNDHPIAPINRFFPDLTMPPPNLERARQLLTEAGHPNGLQLQLLTADAFPGMVQLADAVQEMAKPAGIEIEVIEAKVPSEIYFTDYWGVVPFYVSAWEFRPSLYETFAIAYHSTSYWNETGWSSPALDQLLDAAQQERSPEQRRVLYREAAQLLMDEGPVMIPYFQPVLVAMRNRVQGFTPHPAGWIDLRDVQLSG
ncbi:MAG: ABC transporter substrate-binding protein [Caldilineaceae bacterium]